MRNLAIKYAILSYRFKPEVPFKALLQEFLPLSPQKAFLHFKSKLPEAVLGILRFGFTDRALADLILYEFDLDLNAEVPCLIFRKTSLDAESIRLSAGVEKEFSPREREAVESLSQWLLDATRNLYRDGLNPSKTQDIRQEYREALRLFADKHQHHTHPVLLSLSAHHAMNAFAHAMTVDAMYKSDAAKALFGDQSGYHQAWIHKQMFRHMISQSVRQYIQSFAA